MRKWEDFLSLVVFVLLAIIATPIYIVIKFVDCLKER